MVCVVRLIINTFVENIQRGQCFIALHQLSNVNKIETGPINILNHIEFETCYMSEISDISDVSLICKVVEHRQS